MKLDLKVISKYFSRENSTKNINSNVLYQRLYVVIIVFAFVFIGISVRLFNISINGNAFIKNIFAHKTHSRNEIVDRNGELLAVDLSIVSLYANPKLITDPNNTAAKLVEIFPNLKKDELIASFKSDKNFIWIERNITPKQQHRVNNLGVPGLEFEKGSKRVYTQGSLFSHILGYVDTDGHGIAGIEKQYDSYLLNPKNDKLKLSLDLRVQNIVHEEITKSIDEFQAKGGVGIVMDATNGEIISLVSLPDFDPHHPNKAQPDNLFNQATLGVYEIGSIMKGLTIAMALETKAVSLNDVYYVKEPLKAARFTIHDYKPKFSYLSIPQIFMYSSNIGTAMISLEVGGKTQRKFLKNWGLFDPLKIELPEKGQPMYPSEKNWSEISTMTISFGHGIAITHLHFLRAAVSLVNGGYIVEPTLMIKKEQENEMLTRVLSPETSKTMQKLMRLTVEHGSGKKANATGYLVGGKTGTAEKSKRGGYSKTEKYSLFFAAFPVNNPRYVTLMILDDPKPNAKTPYTGGGWTAAPLSGNVISRIAPLLNVKPLDNNDPQIKEELWLEFDPSMEEEEQHF